MEDKNYLKQAIAKAKESMNLGGFPAGALVVKNGKIIGEGVSMGNMLNDPTSHGEMAAIREACKNLQNTDLAGAVLYSSLQPCLMCFGAAMWSSISKIIFACAQEKVSPAYYGGHYDLQKINPDLIHPIELIQLAQLEDESLALVREWEKINFK
jgi:guanine deaminase